MPTRKQKLNHQVPSLDYSIIQYKPSIERMEVVNIGVVLFTSKVPVLEFSNSMTKIRILDADVSWDDIKHQIQEIEEATRLLLEAKVSKKDLITFLSREKWIGVQYSQHRTIPTEGRAAQEIIAYLMQNFVFPISRKGQKVRVVATTEHGQQERPASPSVDS